MDIEYITKVKNFALGNNSLSPNFQNTQNRIFTHEIEAVEKQAQVDIVEDSLLKDFAEFLAAEEDFHGSRKSDQMNMLIGQLKID